MEADRIKIKEDKMAFSYKDYEESDEVKRRRALADQYATYNESQAVIDARNAMQQHTSNPVAAWTGGTYGQALQQAVDKIQNREKFSYDLNGDALYKQYKDQYMNLGRLAMADTMGQAAALTGGYGNSYAATAGNQAYQGYLQKLNDVVPELYQMALDRYDREGQDMYNQASLLGQMYGTEYGEYRDTVSDWNTEAARLTDLYNTERNFDYNQFSGNRDYYTGLYNTERQWDYGQYSDAYDRSFANYQQSVSESQFAQNLALEQARLNETIRANQANEAYRNAQLQLQREAAARSAAQAAAAQQATPATTASSSASVGQVVNYVATQRQNGASNASINAQLRAAGVSEQVIKEAQKYAFKDSQVR